MKYRITAIGSNQDRQTIYFAPHYTPVGRGIRINGAFRVNPGAGVERVDQVFINDGIIECREITDAEYRKVTGSDSQG